MTIDVADIWENYEMGALEEKLGELFPSFQFDIQDMLTRILSGDIAGGIGDAFRAVIGGLAAEITALKDVFIWIMVLGIVAALITHFIEIFDNHQIADIGFYFTYLLMAVILIKSFLKSAAVAAETIEKIVTFIRIFIPAYFLSVGVATGSVTATSGYQLTILIIYMVEHVLLKLTLPFIYSYVLLSLINGLWIEERLALLIEGMEKAIRFLLQAAIGVVTGISVFQSMITPAIDSVKATALQKSIAAIPGVGNAADGVVDVVLGSAVLIKNGIGLVFLILLLVVSAVPLLKILLMSALLKIAAAFLGVVSDRRITACADKVGNGSGLLFKTAGTSLLLFLITISVAAYTTNRGF